MKELQKDPSIDFMAAALEVGRPFQLTVNMPVHCMSTWPNYGRSLTIPEDKVITWFPDQMFYLFCGRTTSSNGILLCVDLQTLSSR